MAKTNSALVAQLIRAELKSSFPNIKFSVTSKTYSGGDSVDIEYTDAVKVEEVEAIVNKYKAGSFDGSIDSYVFSDEKKTHPTVLYVFVKREMSKEAKQEILTKLSIDEADYEKWNNNYNEWNSTVVYRLFRNTEFKVGVQ